MKPFVLASKRSSQNTIIKVNTDSKEVLIGQGYCTLIAGPCAVEDEDSYINLAVFLKEMGPKYFGESF